MTPLGRYNIEEEAARVYDLAELKFRGPSTRINFPLEDYREELEEMNNMTRQEYVAHLRRKSSGFSRGASIYRGVISRYHEHGRWMARINRRFCNNKMLYLGTFSTYSCRCSLICVLHILVRLLQVVSTATISRY
ncbi:hypothetical protein PR202_ga13634 [Eleusine coracana subsp. coracana]|uniref:AP2/ERF domain-containing protein n=1 Tax=Eleusine coracana subsp. coracana TaxID=191504 RepID=A0AAV5CFG1_ELECO|nr:hypothetical protein PR202_ga13634 [Eleusine coracana subsp. coracana]